MISGTLLLGDVTKPSELLHQLWTPYFQTNKGQGINVPLFQPLYFGIAMLEHLKIVLH